MIEYILGNYLIEIGKITKEQQRAAVDMEDSVNVTPELIAAESGVAEQAAVSGKRSRYFQFLQALVDAGHLKLDELEGLLKDFGEKNGYGFEQMNDFKSGDTDRIVPLFLPKEAEHFAGLVSLVIDTVMKTCGRNVGMGKGVMTDALPTEDMVNQSLLWDGGIVDYFSEMDGGLLAVSCAYGQENYDKLDLEAMDAAGELLNCINGLYVSGLSREGCYLEMMPPKYEKVGELVKQGSICRIPIFVDGGGFYFTVAELV